MCVFFLITSTLPAKARAAWEFSALMAFPELLCPPEASRMGRVVDRDLLRLTPLAGSCTWRTPAPRPYPVFRSISRREPARWLPGLRSVQDRFPLKSRSIPTGGLLLSRTAPLQRLRSTRLERGVNCRHSRVPHLRPIWHRKPLPRIPPASS